MSSYRNLRGFTRTQLSSRSKAVLVLWFFAQRIFLKSTILPSFFRPVVLKLFGATMGKRVYIRRGVNIHFPWNLTVGDDCWIGENVWFINHEKITLESNVCISQRSIICSSSHDYKSSSLEYDHKSVIIKNGAWVCLDVKVLPGVTIGECSVISAGEVVRKSVPDFSMLVGGQLHPIEPPK